MLWDRDTTEEVVWRLMRSSSNEWYQMKRSASFETSSKTKATTTITIRWLRINSNAQLSPPTATTMNICKCLRRKWKTKFIWISPHHINGLFLTRITITIQCLLQRNPSLLRKSTTPFTAAATTISIAIIILRAILTTLFQWVTYNIQMHTITLTAIIRIYY